MIRSIVLLLCFCCLCAACAKKTNVLTNPDDFVAVTLGNAAEQAHGELAMLAKLRGQGLQPLLPPPDPSLTKAVSVSWTGPADGALKEICLQTGYRYQIMGTPSAQALVVVVHGLNRPAYDLIEDIAWQIQPQAVVRVDPIGRVITLARTTKGKE
ncbi:MAG: DotD/TraH family lipoprotein [Desulfovibrio sp.]|nr:DotD/TraH family lipoprotein [Desulfovibrio sp.]